jgi:formylglycine-generating enzyme required for sulfatase activity
MTDVLRNASRIRSARIWLTGLLIGVLAASAAIGAEGDATGQTFDPNDWEAVKWLPLARRSPAGENPDAEAADEAGMKAYAEAIPGTDLRIEMIPIPSGKFVMGSPESEAGRGEGEGPQHEVEVDAFWMGKTEITWEQYDAWSLKLDVTQRKMKRDAAGEDRTNWDKLVDAIARPTNAYTDMTFGMGHDGYPAICMTQFAAKVYCKWLTANTGRYYRLPTEAEWEYACRAGTTTAYSFGDSADDLDEYAWYFDNSEDGYAKVGQKKPNPWGLHDMHGNVCEWVLDQYDPEFYKTHGGKTVRNPLNDPKTLFPRCVRGGSWLDDAEDLRSAARRGSDPDWKMQDPQIPQSIWYLTDAEFLGFRVVRPLRMPTADEAKLYEPDPQVIQDYREAQGGKM